MKTIDLQLNSLKEAPWNANSMDQAMLNRLKESLRRYGLVAPLVVRPIDGSTYQVLSGNHRLRAITEMGFDSVPCVIVAIDDADAMLLAQALNGIHGQDDIGLKGALLEKVLTAIPEEKVLSLLPETAESLRSLASLTKADLAEHLQAWEKAQSARLNHLQLQLTRQQLDVVQEAVNRIMPRARDAQGNNPNARSNAIYLLCKFYLEKRSLE